MGNSTFQCAKLLNIRINPDITIVRYGKSQKNIIFRRAYARIFRENEHCFTLSRFVASLPFHALRYRFGCLICSHARRFDDFSAEGQTRPDIRVRIRSIAIRTRVRHTATRTRTVAATINHTAE